MSGDAGRGTVAGRADVDAEERDGLTIYGGLRPASTDAGKGNAFGRPVALGLSTGDVDRGHRLLEPESFNSRITSYGAPRPSG